MLNGQRGQRCHFHASGYLFVFKVVHLNLVKRGLLQARDRAEAQNASSHGHRDLSISCDCTTYKNESN